jgi:hypothetical protein
MEEVWYSDGCQTARLNNYIWLAKERGEAPERGKVEYLPTESNYYLQTTYLLYIVDVAVGSYRQLLS